MKWKYSQFLMARGNIIRSVSVNNVFATVYNLVKNVLAMYAGVI